MKAYCEKHGEFEQEELELFGKKILSMCPVCEQERDQEIEQSSKAEEIERREKLLKSCGIPERFKDCTLDNYRIDNDGQEKALQLTQKYILRFEESRVSNPMFLCGVYGTGKTHLAIGTLKQLIDSGKIKTALYVTTMRMIRDIRGSYHHKSEYTEQEIIDKYISKDLLVLDEVGLQVGTDNEKLLIYEVLNGRYEEMKPTILISNLPYKDLTNYLGERVVDRLRGKGGVLAVFDWQSERGKA